MVNKELVLQGEGDMPSFRDFSRRGSRVTHSAPGFPLDSYFVTLEVTTGPARGAGRAGAQFPAPAGCVERRRVRLLCTEPIRVSARPSQPVTLSVGEKGKSLFLNAETGYGIVFVSEFMF